MRNTLFAAAAVLAVATQAAHAQQPPSASINAGLYDRSAAALDTLSAEWDRIGFMSPSKPSQYRVYGRQGYVTDGPGYNRMVALIRAAARDQRNGRDADALEKIALVHSLLVHPG